MKKSELTEEIRRITNETASIATSKALEVAEQAKAKAAEVSTLAIAEALKAATLAATKAADAASAAAAIAASTSKDLEYIKSDIAVTKTDIKSINEKLDVKYLSKSESYPILYKAEVDKKLSIIDKLEEKFVTKEVFSTVKTIVYGMVALILTSVMGGIMFLVIK